MENKDRHDNENGEVESLLKHPCWKTSQALGNDFEQNKLKTSRIDKQDIRESVTEESKSVSNGAALPRNDDLETELVDEDSKGIFKSDGVLSTGEELDDTNENVDINEETSQIEDINLAPDGGYGWFIVFGSMLVHLCIGGLERSSGILFLKFDEKFQQSAVATAWVLSLSSGLRLTLGPLCSMLCNRFSHRSVVIGGTLVIFISMISTALSPNLAFTYFSYSVLGGVGRLFAYAPAVIIVGEYFNKKRGLAVGLATSGVGFGSFIFPTMIDLLFKFYGYFGSFFLLGAVMSHLFISGCLFRPLSLHIQMTTHHVRDKDLDTELGTELLEQKLNHDIQKHNKNKTSISSRKSNSTPKKKILDFSLLKDLRFFCFCVAILLFSVAFQAAFVFIPPYAKSKGMSDLQASYVVSITGIFDGVGRIIAGFVGDLKQIKKYRAYIYNAMMFMIAAISFIVPSVDTFVALAVVCSCYGLFVGTYVSQKSVVIVDILGVKNLVSSFGILIFFQGLGMFVGPPIAGIMKDINGHFNDGFYLGGVAMIFGGVVLGAGNLYHYFRQSKTVS